MDNRRPASAAVLERLLANERAVAERATAASTASDRRIAAARDEAGAIVERARASVRDEVDALHEKAVATSDRIIEQETLRLERDLEAVDHAAAEARDAAIDFVTAWVVAATDAERH